MWAIALKMLVGDRAKYFALIFGIAFATLLMSQQVSIFISLMARTANQIIDVREADVWVMDPRVNYFDENEPLPDADLYRVRGVDGVAWAAPLIKTNVIFRTPDGLINQINLVGVDDASLIGAPRDWIEGSLDALREPDAIVLDRQGADFIWPERAGGSFLNLEGEINDRRVVVRGVADVSATFQTFPIVYTRYSHALEITPPTRNKLSYVIVKAADGEDPKALAQRIEAETGLQALTWVDFAWRSVNYILTRTGIPVNFGITIVLAIIVGAAITAQTFYLFVVENLKQFGALKAIGATNAQISGMVLLQSAVVGAIGYGIGIGMCALFFSLSQDVPALEGFYLRWQVVYGVGAVVAVIIVLASLGSLLKVFRVDPAIVFRG
jgi:putative ABC transport system permease protein